MRTWRKIALGLFVIACLLLALWAGAIIFGFINSPLSYKEMDFDEDGRVTLSEISEALTAGHTEVVVGSKKCTQYFTLKDGRSLKLICSEK